MIVQGHSLCTYCILVSLQQVASNVTTAVSVRLLCARGNNKEGKQQGGSQGPGLEGTHITIPLIPLARTQSCNHQNWKGSCKIQPGSKWTCVQEERRRVCDQIVSATVLFNMSLQWNGTVIFIVLCRSLFHSGFFSFSIVHLLSGPFFHISDTKVLELLETGCILTCVCMYAYLCSPSKAFPFFVLYGEILLIL